LSKPMCLFKPAFDKLRLTTFKLDRKGLTTPKK
jgi:hypothetical protein